ncbi:MAG TPA: response regulator [Thermomicrobiales bacterium]|jgi:DNA-binding response OmpR family regulator|nr:response regulator [Thermomicrobiales bacterium]
MDDVSFKQIREASRVQGQRKHVFVVNGSPEFLDLLRELMQEEGYNVTTTNFVPRTFDQIRALEPDLIVIDIVIGQIVGWDLLVQLQHEATTSDVPVLIASTDPHLLERAESVRLHFPNTRFIGKPLDLDALLGMINDLIGPA